MSEGPDLRLLKRLRRKLKAAEVDFHVAVVNELRPGTQIDYEMAGHPQTGTVESVVGFAGTTGIQVTNNKTGKTYRISPYDIPALRGTPGGW